MGQLSQHRTFPKFLRLQRRSGAETWDEAGGVASRCPGLPAPLPRAGILTHAVPMPLPSVEPDSGQARLSSQDGRTEAGGPGPER